MTRRIMVPLDGTPFSEAALGPAAALARRTGGTLFLVTVEEFRSADARPPWKADEPEAAWIEALATRLAGAGVYAETAVLHGGIGEELLSFGRREDIDLAVMTTHGRGPLSRAWLGSVADRMAREAPFPVLAVRPEAAALPIPPDPDAFPRKVLVALDGSPLAESIVPRVLEWVGREGVEIALVRVVLPAEAMVPAYVPDAARYDEELLEARYREAQAYLQEVARGLHDRGWTVRTEVRTASRAATGIAAFARAWGADLVALATHGRGGLARAVLGSVADKVLRSADRAVFLHRPTPIPGSQVPRREEANPTVVRT